jgi:hypothetical protein
MLCPVIQSTNRDLHEHVKSATGSLSDSKVLRRRLALVVDINIDIQL